LTAAFAHLASDYVICDLDVDAPDLHLLLHPQVVASTKFYSGHEAHIIAQKCDGCGLCREMCRFGAVFESPVGYEIDPLKCEGCNVCVAFCPAGAIDFPEKYCGDWYLSNTRFGRMVHAQLFPAEENSGKLVALLRQKARKLAEEHGIKKILCDGPPGIGCPVISALSGTSFAVIVTEPTPSGHHDLERIIELCRHFQVPAGVIVNKTDLNDVRTRKIEAYCQRQGIDILGRLPHDPAVTQAMVLGQTITEYQPGEFGAKVQQIWFAIEKMAEVRAAA
jgi:MinD superfamily P-loop ATPase